MNEKTMKRDMELVRKILIALEQHEKGHAPTSFEIEGYTSEQVGYHCYLMGEANLLVVADATHMGSSGPEATPISISWAGHDFLEAARDEKIWRRAMNKVKEHGGAVTFGVLMALLSSYIKERLGLD